MVLKHTEMVFRNKEAEKNAPHDVKQAGEIGSKRVPFGKEMAKLFMFDEGWRNMNHGSFGTCPTTVQQTLQSYQLASETRPDHFIRFVYPTLLVASRHALASVLQAPPSTIVLVPNATTGVNTFLRNLVFAKGDTILYFSTTYGACAKTILSIAETTPVTPTQIPLLTRAALSSRAIVAAVKETIANQRAQGLRPRALLLDTVVSMPGIRLPFEELTALCRENDIYSVVDGAHGIGMVPLDLPKWDPDFFVSNAHKWLHVPRACAVVYVPQRNQALMRTSFPTSHFFVPEGTGSAGAVNPLPLPKGANKEDDGSPFVAMFSYTGTLDNSPYLCVPKALEFRREVCGGEEEVMKYCAGLAREGGDKVAEMLGTDCLDNEEGTLRDGCSMVCVRLPLDPQVLMKRDGEEAKGKLPSLEALFHILTKVLDEEYDTVIPIIFWGDSWYARLSGQIYLDMEDFKWTGKVLKEICEKVMDGRIGLGA